MFYKKGKCLAIIGRQQLNEVPIPWDDFSYDLCFVGYSLYARKELIELHPKANICIVEIHTIETRKAEYRNWLYNSVTVPKFVEEQYKDMPGGIAYPKKEIEDKYGSKYFLCSMSYMVALAMYMGYEEIEFFEINMLMDDDLVQKSNLEYWIGRAEGAGIKVIIHDTCDLLKCAKSYGYEAVNTLGVGIEKLYNAKKENMISTLNLAKMYTEGILDLLHDCEYDFNLCFKNRTNLMDEIFNRHGINKPKDESKCVDYL
jgi:hypothetical protein